MLRVRIILLVTLLCLSGSLLAQKVRYSTKEKKAISAYEKARVHFDATRDNLAVEELEKAVKIDAEFTEAYILLAQILCLHKKYEEGVVYYQKVIEIDPEFSSLMYVYLAQVQMKLKQYDEAIANVEVFLKSKNLSIIERKKGEIVLERAEFAAYAVKNPVPFDPQNLGENINSTDADYWPTISADNQTFVLTRTEKKGVNARGDVLKEDFYISKKDANGNWKKAENVGPPINTRGNEGSLALSPDGQFVFFVACNREDGRGSCDLYIAKRSGDLWMKPLNLGATVNSNKWDSSPSFSSDGKTLYFSSARPGGLGGMDIWKTVFDGKRWSKPQNVREINSKKDETTVFIHPDGKTLYLSTNGRIGMGGLDLFYARMQENGKWGEPINLGYPINTEGEERGLTVSADASLAYIVSDRKGGLGGMDIYSFELYEEARPNKVTYLKGKVYDIFSKQPLGAKFELIDLKTHETIVQSQSDDRTGEFLVCLPTDRDYALNVSKEGYLFHSESFSLSGADNSSEPYFLDVPLQPMKAGGTIVLKNVFFNTAKYDLLEKSQVELDKLVAFLNTSPTVKIELGGHTDNVGNKAANQILSENRAKAVLAYLVSKGIVASRLSFKGYGDDKPIASNETEEGRQQNRRTEFKIMEL